MEVSLQEILEARERRAQKQTELLAQFGKPLICFTMNIPGPIKNSPLITKGFQQGNQLLTALLTNLPILHKEESYAPTGCEAYYVVDAPAKILKLRAVHLEDSSPVARLYDIDVLDTSGHKLERHSLGYLNRTCLICDQPASICGRSRAHSVSQLQEKTTSLLQEAACCESASGIAQMAQTALLLEVCTTPKPGLVDCRNNGSHKDMDLFTFLSSASALFPYFEKCAQIGNDAPDLHTIFPQLRAQGMLAEEAMYQATGGVNTHKGAIFSLGILCAATGQLPKENRTPEKILTLCKEITRGLCKRDFAHITSKTAKTAGEKLYADLGITGVRGLAESGFPQVLQMGLPILKEGLGKGLPLNDTGCAVLLHLMSVTVDTNLIHRSSLQRQQEISQKISNLLKAEPFPPRQTLEELDDAFIAENLSPGGCADLLAVTYFLHLIQ